MLLAIACYQSYLHCVLIIIYKLLPNGTQAKPSLHFQKQLILRLPAGDACEPQQTATEIAVSDQESHERVLQSHKTTLLSFHHHVQQYTEGQASLHRRMREQYVTITKATAHYDSQYVCEVKASEEVEYIDLIKQGSLSTLHDSVAPNEASDLPTSAAGVLLTASELNQYKENIIEIDSLPSSASDDLCLSSSQTSNVQYFPLEFNQCCNDRTFDPFTKAGKR
ncbi:hypothetical protein FGO68_gene13286 [Halteria grandinella]|uniref:Uncharacterized protein n=1 Tax=Halteria grandinella TaxID=5974 RepID=A0A8J8T3Z6_HALGN|nr:hypothetical protein FGO68_gene13286 [Halteria grandinella]